LAQRALAPVIPSKDDFPYTVSTHSAFIARALRAHCGCRWQCKRPVSCLLSPLVV